jgi:hypothetical protein
VRGGEWKSESRPCLEPFSSKQSYVDRRELFITSCDARVVWVQGEGNVCRAYHFVCEDATAICVYSEVKGEHSDNTVIVLAKARRKGT